MHRIEVRPRAGVLDPKGEALCRDAGRLGATPVHVFCDLLAA